MSDTDQGADLPETAMAAADRQQALGLYRALIVAPAQPEPAVAADVVVQLGLTMVIDVAA